MIKDDGVYETILELEKELQWRIEVVESELLDLCKSIEEFKKALLRGSDDATRSGRTL